MNRKSHIERGTELHLEMEKTMRYYTGVGSRETPKNVLDEMTLLAGVLEEAGYTLRSGGAEGADAAFEAGVRGEAKQIFLPWAYFNEHRSTLCIPSLRAFEIAKQVHPAWHRLTRGGEKLHARNAHQVLGPDLETPSEFVLCWTLNGEVRGGTATAIRIAQMHQIPVFNLANPGDRQEWSLFSLMSLRERGVLA